MTTIDYAAIDARRDAAAREEMLVRRLIARAREFDPAKYTAGHALFFVHDLADALEKLLEDRP